MLSFPFLIHQLHHFLLLFSSFHSQMYYLSSPIISLHPWVFFSFGTIILGRYFCISMGPAFAPAFDDALANLLVWWSFFLLFSSHILPSLRLFFLQSFHSFIHFLRFLFRRSFLILLPVRLAGPPMVARDDEPHRGIRRSASS